VHYQTIFDLDQVGYRSWWFPASGLLFIAGAALLLRTQRILAASNLSFLLGTPQSWMIVAVLKFAIGFSVLWTPGAFGLTYPDYREARSALDRGHYSVNEGEVADYVMVPLGQRGLEHFTAGGQTFSYRPSDLSPGFNNSGTSQGAIRVGEYVRVTSDKGIILRLEIGQP
jgi:hypothetical protein